LVIVSGDLKAGDIVQAEYQNGVDAPIPGMK
jgi:hypothetical protein